VGATEEVVSNEPPSFEGMNPSQIEKILIEQLLKGPEKKEAFNFTKTVKPILDAFKVQLLEDKRKMQKQLDDDIKAIQACITKMKQSTQLALMEEHAVPPQKKFKKKGSKPKNKCPTTKEVQKCKDKIKNLKPKQKACKDLQGIGKKDIDSIIELVKKWNKQKVPKKDCVQDKGETKYHYVKRLGYHFTTKLKKFEKQLAELTEKKKQGEKN